MNLKKIKYFISKAEKKKILRLGDVFAESSLEIKNEHIKAVKDSLNGFSVLCDLTKTDVSKEISSFQGDSSVIEKVDDIFLDLSDKISKAIGISNKHVFFQYINSKPGGAVHAHYDASVDGYITYKCNIVIKCQERDKLYVDKNIVFLDELDLCCFEANLYKHWMDKSEEERVLLSYGFMIPYEEMGWKENDPRIRMQKRMSKYFQKSI